MMPTKVIDMNDENVVVMGSDFAPRRENAVSKEINSQSKQHAMDAKISPPT